MTVNGGWYRTRRHRDTPWSYWHYARNGEIVCGRGDLFAAYRVERATVFPTRRVCSICVEHERWRLTTRQLKRALGERYAEASS